MTITPDTNTLTPLVSRFLDVQEITWGDRGQRYVARYRGRLRIDPAEAYDQLATALRHYDLTPLFREEEGLHTIILARGIAEPKPSNPWVNVALFIVTLFSMLLAGAEYVYNGPQIDSIPEYLNQILGNIGSGLPFGLSLLAILAAHEFGHYLAAQYHRSPVTLPYFLPLPPTPFGTLGAFIQLKKPPKNKRVLLDIGLAGPLAGLVVAIPVLLIGLSLSTLDTIPRTIPPGSGISLEGNSILYLLAKYITQGQWLPQPATYGGVSPWVYWLRYLFTGQPTPLGGVDVFLHPMAWAGWAGLLVTALNLIPAGQLDGGHVLYVLFGRGARRLLPIILAVLAVLGFVWSGWWLWVFLILFLGRVYAEPLDQITPLDPRRKALAIFGLVVFVLVFTPVPLRLILGTPLP